MRGLKLTLERPPPNHSLGSRGLSCSKDLIQGTFRQLVCPLFRPSCPTRATAEAIALVAWPLKASRSLTARVSSSSNSLTRAAIGASCV
jgi:hypothetical protein